MGILRGTFNIQIMEKLFRLTKNDLKTRYSNSIFGVVWVFILPIVTILVFWYVFQLGFKNLPVGDAPFILWFTAAYVPWVFFSDAILTGTNSLVEYSYLVQKVKFNITLIPPIKLLSALLVHLFFIVFMVLMAFALHFQLSVYIFQLVYYMFAICVFSAGMIFLLAAINVFFKDMAAVVSIGIQIGFWVTPIMWNEEVMVNETVRHVLSFNPAHYFVQGYRDSLINHRWFWEKPQETIYFWLITTVIVCVGLIVFKRLSPFFADEV